MGSRIYVGNLPFSADESQIRALFEPSGGVREVRIVEDRETGRPRGFAFVEMNSDSRGPGRDQGRPRPQLRWP